MSIAFCKLKFLGNKECFTGFTSLEKLRIVECPELISSWCVKTKSMTRQTEDGFSRVHLAYWISMTLP